MAFSDFNIGEIIHSSEFKSKINLIRKNAELRLTEAIWDHVYAAYTPVTDPDIWHRTYELLHAVRSSFDYDENLGLLIVKVYLDHNEMNHTSIITDRPVYIAPLVNYGFYWSDWAEEPEDYFHNRPPSYYLEKAMNQIQTDMEKATLDAVVTAVNSNIYKY